MAAEINKILIPNVTKTSGHRSVDVSNKLLKSEGSSEFSELLKSKVSNEKPLHGGIELSTHAQKRLQERQIDFNGEEYMKVKEAMTKIAAKGGKNSLIISDKAAYIVDVTKNKIVTAVDKNNMSENIFTKIDSTMFVN